MVPLRFSVSQVRVAATCPRILYFDALHTRRARLKQPCVTRLWKVGASDQTACGSLFHAAIEKFNATALTSPAVRELLVAGPRESLAQRLLAYIYRECVHRERLFEATGAQQEAFITALQHYLKELADILVYGLSEGMSVEAVLEAMFGDRRRRVDVTFEVGPQGEPVNVTGILDYVFYDWRNGRRRILDYKLTPGNDPMNDLFQVCVYALMHHVQHRTQPDVGVLYLHPARQMVEKPWEQIYAERHKVYDLLASMAGWVGYDAAKHEGLKPPGEPSVCSHCRWNQRCAAELGPKNEGQRYAHWAEAASRAAAVEPVVRREGGADHEADAATDEADRQTAAAAEPSPADAPPADALPAELPEDHLWLGRAEDGRPVGLPRSALATHVAIVGAAGSGKTYLAKVLAEEAVLQGIPVLAVDPQGDLVQFLRQRQAGEFFGAEAARYRRYVAQVEPRVFTPGSSHGIRINLNPLRLARDEDLARIADPQRRKEELDNILATVAGNVVALAKAGGEVDSQRTLVWQLLHRLVARASTSDLQMEDLVKAVSEPGSVGLEDVDALIRKAEREKLARRLNALVCGPAANLFSGAMAVDLEAFCRPHRPGKTPLNVIYLNALVDDDQKQFFVASLAAEIYRWMITSLEPGDRPNLLFYLDEARDYVPAGMRKPPAKEPLVRLFAQGRKYGVGCLMCTQSPRSVDYQVFGNASTKIIGRLESAQDVDRVAEWFRAEKAAAWLSDRKGAATGSFVARWPAMPESQEGRSFRSRTLFSVHEGAWPPDRVEREVAEA